MGKRVFIEQRVRLADVLSGAVGAPERADGTAAAVQRQLRSECGVRFPPIEEQLFLLTAGAAWRTFEMWFIERCTHQLVPSVIEAVVARVTEPGACEDALNGVLAEERLAYELIAGQMVEFESRELHAEIVGPSLRLLSGRPGWEAVEDAYQKALREVAEDPQDAITDAARTLDEALGVRGCEGQTLGDRIKIAKKRGMLAPHDEILSKAIASIMDWVSADRSRKGDAHTGARADSDDAWFISHIVGALILRLAGGDRRQ